jgi:hypothetical protein
VHHTAFPEELNFFMFTGRGQLFDAHPFAGQKIAQQIGKHQSGIERMVLQAVVEVKVREEIQKCKGRKRKVPSRIRNVYPGSCIKKFVTRVKSPLQWLSDRLISLRGNALNYAWREYSVPHIPLVFRQE